MRKPVKPGTDASKTQGGGSLGNIDEETGHPSKGTKGKSVKQEQSGDPGAGREGGKGG